ncbi:unnamed protein product [Mytilus coruscus]|uniref:C2H2-type domain-containing protein n=1 Tax=Mytilus coruscus TaxID=42192 RepID=A0A6J8AKM0_MYTCO|nr:unnamed protein product [Mytilus coruscus]
MDTSVQAHHFFYCLTPKYPPGSEPLESEIRNLKRKLNHEEFSDCDEVKLVREVENVEQAHSKKPKLKHECDICGKTFHQIHNKIQHMKAHCTSFKCDKCEKSFSRNNYRNTKKGGTESVLAALHPVERNPDRVSHYMKYEDSLNLTGIDFPVSLAKVEKFEKQTNLSINVFGWEDGEIFPLYMTKMSNGSNEIDLLYLFDDKNSHYCWIKNLSRFLGHTHNKSHTKLHYCHRCLRGFIRQDLLDAHRPYCERFDFQKVQYPKEGEDDILRFKDYHKTMKVPFVIYADF